MIQDEVFRVLQNQYTNNEAHKLKLLEVLYLTQYLLEKHSLKDIEIKFLRHSDALGMCFNNGEKISLQISHAIYSEIDEIKNTILHEIAHALVGNEFMHNDIWKEKAKELGVKLNKQKEEYEN